MGHLPFVSVITAAYNPGFLARCIESVREQRGVRYEHIIMDDGSETGIGSLALTYGDSRMRLLRQPHAGAASAMNAAIGQSSAPFFAILDEDDLLTPGSLLARAEYLESHPESAGVSGSIEIISREGGLLGTRLKRLRASRDLRQDLLFGTINPLPHCSLMIRTDQFRRAGAYDPSLGVAYDKDLLVRLLAEGPIGEIDPVVARYRRHANNLSTVRRRLLSRELHEILDRYAPPGAHRAFAHAKLSALNVLKTAYLRIRFLPESEAAHFTDETRPQRETSYARGSLAQCASAARPARRA